jgi:hypothetical protein
LQSPNSQRAAPLPRQCCPPTARALPPNCRACFGRNVVRNAAKTEGRLGSGDAEGAKVVKQRVPRW